MYTASDKLRFFEKCFGRIEVGRGGLNAAVKCPNCGYGEKRKFVIRMEDDACHCWVCGLKGKNLLYILKKYGTPDLLQEYQTVFCKDKKISVEMEEAEQVLRLPSSFQLIATNLSTKNPDLRAAISYLYSRGLKEDDLWYYKFGYVDHGSYRRRVIMPSFDRDGDLNYFVSRAVDKDVKPKYLNAPVDKKSIVFNEINIDWKKEVTIVEGPFDLSKCTQNSVSILGSEISESTLLFARLVQNSTPVLLALDSDMVKKTQKIAKLLTRFNLDVRILDLGDRHDVGEMTKQEFAERQQAAKPWTKDDGLLYKINTITSSSIRLRTESSVVHTRGR